MANYKFKKLGLKLLQARIKENKAVRVLPDAIAKIGKSFQRSSVNTGLGGSTAAAEPVVTVDQLVKEQYLKNEALIDQINKDKDATVEDKKIEIKAMSENERLAKKFADILGVAKVDVSSKKHSSSNLGQVLKAKAQKFKDWVNADNPYYVNDGWDEFYKEQEARNNPQAAPEKKPSGLAILGLAPQAQATAEPDSGLTQEEIDRINNIVSGNKATAPGAASEPQVVKEPSLFDKMNAAIAEEEKQAAAAAAAGVPADATVENGTPADATIVSDEVPDATIIDSATAPEAEVADATLESETPADATIVSDEVPEAKVVDIPVAAPVVGTPTGMPPTADELIAAMNNRNNQELVNTKTELDTTKAENEQLKAQLTTMKADMKSADEAAGKILAENDRVVAENNAIKAERDKAISEKAALEAKVAEALNINSTLQTQVAQIALDQQAMKTTIDTQQTEIDKLKPLAEQGIFYKTEYDKLANYFNGVTNAAAVNDAGAQIK